MYIIFNPILDKGVEDLPKIERIHRVGKPKNTEADWPRDITVRFRFFKDKAEIWEKMRRKPPIKYERSELQFFTDLAPETLARRRILKPLLEQMCAKNIKYIWGFPACLIGQKEGIFAKLRFYGRIGRILS